MIGSCARRNKIGGGSYTEIVYAPSGAKLALMTGLTTLQKGYVPLNGGIYFEWTGLLSPFGLDRQRHWRVSIVRIVGSFGVPGFRMDRGFYLRPLIRSRQFILASTVLVLLCGYAFDVVVKAWARFSVFTVTWIGISLVFLVLMFRVVLRTHEILHLLLTSGQVEKPENGSPLAVVLNLLADVSNNMLFFGFASIFAMLMAISLVLFWR